MPRSMTGYGRAVKTFEKREVTVEIKAVNHRFFEFSARTPRQYNFLEERLKKLFSAEINRGKVEAYVSVTSVGDPDETVEPNTEVIKSYVDALRSVGETVSLNDDLSLSQNPRCLYRQRGRGGRRRALGRCQADRRRSSRSLCLDANRRGRKAPQRYNAKARRDRG